MRILTTLQIKRWNRRSAQKLILTFALIGTDTWANSTFKLKRRNKFNSILKGVKRSRNNPIRFYIEFFSIYKNELKSQRKCWSSQGNYSTCTKFHIVFFEIEFLPIYSVNSLAVVRKNVNFQFSLAQNKKKKEEKKKRIIADINHAGRRMMRIGWEIILIHRDWWWLYMQ